MEKTEKAELKSGIEIHQQLDTGKLFCNCPSILRKGTPDSSIMRKLHVVAGESGEIDKAARFEAEQAREFVYEVYNDTTCLVELDESPPELINQEALKIAIQISLLLNCEILQDTQIMRKTVIDGSNVGGFQRTVLIAKNGYLDTTSGRIGIQSVCLEEDAARIIKRERKKIIYRLDRLGIPLIEIATSPDIKTAKQAREVALHIGDILRACKVKRGIGSIRQDVNMSIKIMTEKAREKQGARIEIKGVQEPALIEKTIGIETERQKKLTKIGKSRAEVRKANQDGSTSFLRPLPGAARMYPETDLPLLKISRDMINDAKRNLPKLKSEIKTDLSKTGLSEEMIKLILQRNKLEEFKELIKISSKADLIAKMLVLWPKEISVKEKMSVEKLEKKISLDVLEEILNAVNKGKIDKSYAKIVLRDIAKGKSLKEALEFEKAENIEEEILKIVKKKPGLSFNAYMGVIMAKFKGKVSGKEIMEILKRILN